MRKLIDRLALRRPLALVLFLVAVIASLHPSTLVHAGPSLLVSLGPIGAALLYWSRAGSRSPG
jgi:hypothetical protein